MAEANDKTQTNEGGDELVLDDVVALDADALSNEQKTFLEENKDKLTPEQAKKFGIELEEEEIDLEKLEPEARAGKEEKKKEEEEEEEEEEIEPEDLKAIGKVVKKQLEPVARQIQDQRDQLEVDAFIQVKPEFAKYRGAILKYMKHPAYAQIPAHNIAAIVASKDLMKIGAKKEREAQKKINETKNPGSGTRPAGGGAKDWHTATKDEFEAKKAEVLGRR